MKYALLCFAPVLASLVKTTLRYVFTLGYNLVYHFNVAVPYLFVPALGVFLAPIGSLRNLNKSLVIGQL